MQPNPAWEAHLPAFPKYKYQKGTVMSWEKH